MNIVALRILGECEIAIADRRIHPDSPHLFLLLLVLTATPGSEFTRSQLADFLFPASHDPRSAAHNLRQLLYRLRRAGAPLTVDGQSVAVAARSVHNSIDAFLADTPSARLNALQRGVSILPQYFASSESASTWLESYRDQQHNAIRRQLLRDLHLYRQHADWPAVDVIANSILSLDPLNESATLALAESVARTGSKALALSLLDRYEREMGHARPALSLPAKLLRTRLSERNAPERRRHTSPTLIGRATEMERLAALWQQTRRGHFHIVHTHGPKAVGKSRLTEEFRTLLSNDGSGAVVYAQAQPRDRDRPLSLFSALLSDLLALPGAAGCSPEALALLGRLTKAVVPNGPIGPAGASSAFDEAVLRNAVADLITSVSEEKSLLCVVDDAHDLDSASVSMLNAIQQRHRLARVMFILTSRHAPPSLGTLASDTWVDMRVQPLAHADAFALAEAITRSATHALAPADLQWVLDVASGNPGHIELLIANNEGSGGTRAVPADIIALIDERIAILSREAHHALCATAVAAEGIWPRELAAVTGLTEWSLLTALDELDGAGLLRRSDTGILCRSSVITERILSASSVMVVALLHERLALRLELSFGGNASSARLAWRIAGHWKAAGQSMRARSCLRACWQQSIDIGQPVTACDAIQRELALANSPEDRAELLDDLIGALQAAGELGAVYHTVCERQNLSTRVGDSDARIAALAFDRLQAELLFHSTPAKHCEALMAHLRSRELNTERRLRAARLLMMAADELLDESLAITTFMEGTSIETVLPNCLILQKHLGLIFHAVFGDRDAGLRISEEITSDVNASENSWLKFLSRRTCSLAQQLIGQDAYDHSQIERDYFECIDANMITAASQCATHLATILIDDGDLECAKKWLAMADGLMDSDRQLLPLVDYLSGQVDLALLSGDEARARHFLARMHENAHKYECGRLRNDLLLYRLRVEQVCRSVPASVADLNELLRFHQVARRFGRHDDHMDVLWVALRAAGRADEAHHLLSEYLTVHRRERRSCRYFLRYRTRSDAAWDQSALAR
jgi:DNA-binding SARP family transcriptional activator